MPDAAAGRGRLLARLDGQWRAFLESFEGLAEGAMLEPGVAGDWSVKDVLAHVFVWERECMKVLPLLMAGRRAPRYGGIDRFNAEQAALNARLTLAEAREELQRTHERLVEYLQAVPGLNFAGETRQRRRVRWDTYGHYPLHAGAIRAWRKLRGL